MNVNYDMLMLAALALLCFPGAVGVLTNILSGYHARALWHAVKGGLFHLGEIMNPGRVWGR
jgi:hypothetical protein